MTNAIRPSLVVSLDDGSVYTVLPVCAADKALLKAGFERLSPRSRYLRFFASTPELSRGQLAYLSELDQTDHIALGLLDGDTPAAIGRWVRFEDDPDAADVAVTVVDDYQRRGLGRVLLKLLAQAARHRDVRWLHFDVLAENAGMLALLDGFGAVRTENGPIIHAVLDADTVALPAGVSGSLPTVLDRAAKLAG